MDKGFRTIVPVEFIGGPRDGEREYVKWPPPPEISTPIMFMLRPLTSEERASDSSTDIQVGVYKRTAKQTKADRLTVAHDVTGEALQGVLERAQALEYIWQGT